MLLVVNSVLISNGYKQEALYYTVRKQCISKMSNACTSGWIPCMHWIIAWLIHFVYENQERATFECKAYHSLSMYYHASIPYHVGRIQSQDDSVGTNSCQAKCQAILFWKKRAKPYFPCFTNGAWYGTWFADVICILKGWEAVLCLKRRLNHIRST